MTQKIKKKYGFGTLLGIVALLLAGCAIPFSVTTEKQTVELTNTGSAYVETEIDIPSEARKEGVSFDEVRLKYTVRKSGDFYANVALYADNESEADGQKGDAEQLLEVELSSSEDSESGSATSAKIKQALNDELPRFVAGAENLSTTLTGTVFIDIELTLEGEYDRF